MPDQYNNILAIDTSSKNLMLALSYGEDRIVKSNDNVEQSHGQMIITKIDSLLQSVSLKPIDLHAIIVSTGPGSFTGLRIGIAAAKGMAVTLNIPVVAVNLFELASYKLREVDENVNIVIPLKKDEFFVTATLGGIYNPDIKIVSDKKLGGVMGSSPVAGLNISIAHLFPGYSGKDFSKYLEYDAGDILYLGSRKLELGKIDDLASLEPMYLQKSQAEINFELRNKK